MVQYSGLTDTHFSFYVYDKNSGVAAYCWYVSKIDSAKFEAANLRGKVIRHQVGLGNQVVPFLPPKPLDFKQIQGTACSLSLAGGPSMRGSAELLMNKAPAMHLVFPMVADFSYSRTTQSKGSILEVDVVKTSAPELPARFRDPSRS